MGPDVAAVAVAVAEVAVAVAVVFATCVVVGWILTALGAVEAVLD